MVSSLVIDGLSSSIILQEITWTIFRILHSTFDIDITHCIQVILGSPRLSPVGHAHRLDTLIMHVSF